MVFYPHIGDKWQRKFCQYPATLYTKDEYLRLSLAIDFNIIYFTYLILHSYEKIYQI